MTIFRTKSITLDFAKKLPAPCTHYKGIPDLEPTLPEGLLPDLPEPTQGIDTSLLLAFLRIVTLR